MMMQWTSISNIRLDIFIFNQCVNAQPFSRTQIQKWIKTGCVSVNGVIEQKPNTILNINDCVNLVVPTLQPAILKGEHVDFEIVYEDADLLVINKPNNLVVHPGAGNRSGTLVNGLLGRKELQLSGIGGVERPGIVHRLDKQTTGLIIVAKNDATHHALTEQLKAHQIHKVYVALVWGVIPEAQGIIDAPIGRHPNDRKKMSVTDRNAKHARTHFEVIQRFATTTFVKCWIETGRTHQIRVHFNYIKLPIVNDPVYGRLSDKPDEFGQMLHAYQLKFQHPTTKEMIKLKAELPKEFLRRLAQEGKIENEW